MLAWKGNVCWHWRCDCCAVSKQLLCWLRMLRGEIDSLYDIIRLSCYRRRVDYMCETFAAKATFVMTMSISSLQKLVQCLEACRFYQTMFEQIHSANIVALIQRLTICHPLNEVGWSLSCCSTLFGIAFLIYCVLCRKKEKANSENTRINYVPMSALLSVERLNLLFIQKFSPSVADVLSSSPKNYHTTSFGENI